MTGLARRHEVTPHETQVRIRTNWKDVMNLCGNHALAMRANFAEGISDQLGAPQAPPRRIISAGGRRAAVFIVLALPLASMRLTPTRVSEQYAAGL